jgi:hypothetical protein
MGFVGTLMLTTAFRTTSSASRARVRAVGYLLHLAAGEAFALV